MREILFRGKRTDNGEWVEGSFCPDAIEQLHGIESGVDGFIRRFNSDECRTYMFEVERETVGQYTGLTDRNGRKIFEGDIIKITDTFNKIIYGVVYWCDSAFWADCSQPDGDECFYTLGHLSDCVEVIGNEYDNPELLGVSK